MTASSPWFEMLPEAQRGGVYRAPEDDGAALARAAERLGYLSLHVDLAGCRDKACLLDRFARALAFPQWFGHNWDALADCLTDLEWMPAEGYLLFVDHGTDMAAAAEADFLTALAVLEDAAAFWREQRVPYWVFVDPAVAPSSLPHAQ